MPSICSTLSHQCFQSSIYPDFQEKGFIEETKGTKEKRIPKDFVSRINILFRVGKLQQGEMRTPLSTSSLKCSLLSKN